MSDCWRCHEEVTVDDILARIQAPMFVCSDCGNKRCPKATDHRLGCTASNEPGQAGSAYEHGSGAATARRFTISDSGSDHA